MIQHPYKMTIRAVPPDKRRRDLGNLEKAASDILVHSKVVKDDHLCKWLDIRWADSGPQFQVILEPMPGGDADGETQ